MIMEVKKSLKIKKEKFPESFTKWLGSVQSLIAHSALFVLIFLLGLLGFNWELLMLILTTAVSLEAIYLAIFIQMSVNRTTASLAGVEEDIGDIAEDVEEIAEDVGEIQTNVDELQEDVGEIQVDVSDIPKDIDNIQGEVDDLSGDIGDIAKGDKKTEKRDLLHKELLKNIHKNMNKVKSDLERLRANKKTAAKSPTVSVNKNNKKKKK
jgi:peptidoglycan hydrolase CwlO-like protein